MICIVIVTGVPALLISGIKLPKVGGDRSHTGKEILDKRHMQGSANVEGGELGYAVAETIIVVPHEDTQVSTGAELLSGANSAALAIIFVVDSTPPHSKALALTRQQLALPFF